MLHLTVKKFGNMKTAPITVKYLDHMGSDLDVVNAARVSFDKESDWKPDKILSEKDSKLIDYLAKHKHWSPFSHCYLKFRIKAPIFVARQLQKHTVGLAWNEVSRRYVDSEPEFYFPDVWRVKPEGSVKQGSGTGALDKPSYVHGFCKECGAPVQTLLGHRQKEYCSQTCKSKCTNKHRNPYRVVFDNCKARVKRESVWGFELDFDTFDFPEYCPYLGIKLDYDYGKGSIKENSPSFDRIDSSKGYVSGNVEIVSHKANTMKSNGTVEEQVKMAEAVLLRYKGCVVSTALSPYRVCEDALQLYNGMISDGYTPEQARMVLPQSMITTWIWSGSLAAFARVVKLRTDPHSQYETGLVAHGIKYHLDNLFPVSTKALLAYD